MSITNYPWAVIGDIAREAAVPVRGQLSAWKAEDGRTYWLSSIDLKSGTAFVRLQYIPLPNVYLLVPVHEFRQGFHRIDESPGEPT